MAGFEWKPKKLYVRTPLIESLELSNLVGATVHLKLENTQPSASFKIRGISNEIQKKLRKGYAKFVSASGGNGGLAAAYCARKLKVPIQIFVPESSPEFMVEKLKAEGAIVTVHGSVWNDADAAAREAANKPGCVYIHPFDHPDVWEGHESMVTEIYEDLKGITPDLVVSVVGGGGLICGLVQGMEKVGWKNVPILAMETVGADCFNAAIKAGKVVTTPGITSIAKSLGSVVVATRLFEMYSERPILSEVITDKQCMEALCQFHEDHRMMVEPACATALSSVYCNVIQKLQDEEKLKRPLNNIIIIVCGGFCVNTSYIKQWKSQVGLD